MPIIIKTPRTFIRQFAAADIVELAPILADSEVMRFSVSGPMNVVQVSEALEHIYLPSYQHPFLGVWAIIHVASGKLIGFCGLVQQVVAGKTYVELGYRLAKAFWAQGLGTEVATAIKQYAFDNGLTEIIAIISPENKRSVRVAQKIGMQFKESTVYCGFDVDIYHYSLRD